MFSFSFYDIVVLVLVFVNEFVIFSFMPFSFSLTKITPVIQLNPLAPSLSHPRQRIAIRMTVPTIVPHSGSPNPPYDMPSVCRRHLDHKCSMKGSLGRTFQTDAPVSMPISQRSRTKQNIGRLQNADRRPDYAPRRGLVNENHTGCFRFSFSFR